MGHHEDGGLQGGFGLFKGLYHRPGGLGVQVPRGLVRQDQQRAVDQGPGHGGALLFPAGDLRRVFFPDPGDAEHVAQGVAPGLGLGVDLSADDGGQEDVFPDGEPVQEQKVLEHKAQLPVADLRQGRLVQSGELRIPQADAPLVRGDVAGDAVEQRGLSGAGGAHYRHELAPLYGDGHAFQDLVGGFPHLVRFVQIFHSQHRASVLSHMGSWRGTNAAAPDFPLETAYRCSGSRANAAGISGAGEDKFSAVGRGRVIIGAFAVKFGLAGWGKYGRIPAEVGKAPRR